MTKTTYSGRSCLSVLARAGAVVLTLGTLAITTGPALAGCSRLTVSAPPEYPPFSFQVNGQFTGTGIDLVRQIAADAGLEVDVRFFPSWARVYAGHLDGSIDVIAALYKTPERVEELIFLASYAAERTVVVAAKARPIRFTTWDDLKPLRGAVVNEDSRGDILDHYIAENLTVHKVHSFQYIANLLGAGRADYALVGEYSPNVPAFDYRSEASPFYAIETPMSSEYVYISLSKTSPCAAEADRLRTLLERRIADGTADRLLVKHSVKPAP